MICTGIGGHFAMFDEAFKTKISLPVKSKASLDKEPASE
jgi:dimethylaniline monooxygenase (N-oxide forming)